MATDTYARSLQQLKITEGGDESVSAKPPNVLIYVDEDDRFTEVNKFLTGILSEESYIIYQITSKQIGKQPWLENTALLIVAAMGPLEENIKTAFLKFIEDGGKLFSLNSEFVTPGITLSPLQYDEKFLIGHSCFQSNEQSKEEFDAIHSGKVYSLPSLYDKNTIKELGSSQLDCAESPQPVLLDVSYGKGRSIMCQISLEKSPDDIEIDESLFTLLKKSNVNRFSVFSNCLSRIGIKTGSTEAASLTPTYLLGAEYLQDLLMRSLETVLREGAISTKELTVQFVNCAEEIKKLREDNLAIVVSNKVYPKEGTCGLFDWDNYWQTLKTTRLGRTICYSEVTISTQALLEISPLLMNLDFESGLVAVATKQTSGRGRAGNKWISPTGCLMTSIPLAIPKHTRLGSRLSLLVNVTGLAVVKAIRSLQGYENIPLRIKWPNDIYYGENIKIGGIILTAQSMGNKDPRVVIGCGVNVSNSNPTMCLNDIIARYNQVHGTTLEALTVGKVSALLYNTLEEIITSIQQDGTEKFLQDYYKYWIHSNKKVKIESRNNEECVIIGIDDYGFLLVETPSSHQIALQPDGNSFDLMRNLITLKRIG